MGWLQLFTHIYGKFSYFHVSIYSKILSLGIGFTVKISILMSSLGSFMVIINSYAYESNMLAEICGF